VGTVPSHLVNDFLFGPMRKYFATAPVMHFVVQQADPKNNRSGGRGIPNQKQ
jgi:hypothetical protein